MAEEKMYLSMRLAVAYSRCENRCSRSIGGQEETENNEIVMPFVRGEAALPIP